MSVMVLVEMQVKPEAVNELKGLLKQTLPDTRAYAGCQGIDIYCNVVHFNKYHDTHFY